MAKEIKIDNITITVETDDSYKALYLQKLSQYKEMKGKYLGLFKEKEVIFKKTIEAREEIVKLKGGRNLLEIKTYENIMSHMDILWHKGETGPDGCRKCNKYRNILMSAFDKIERMSGRDVSQDFSTLNCDGGNEIDDNNNFVRRDISTGKIIGGDKQIGTLEDYKA